MSADHDHSGESEKPTVEELEAFIRECAEALYSGHGHTIDELRAMTPRDAMEAAIDDVNRYWGYA